MLDTRYVTLNLSVARIKIAYKLIGNNAFRQCGVVLRKRISGRTLPGKSHLKQKKKKNSNAPRAARTLPVGAIFSVLPTDKIFPAYCANARFYSFYFM